MKLFAVFSLLLIISLSSFFYSKPVSGILKGSDTISKSKESRKNEKNLSFLSLRSSKKLKIAKKLLSKRKNRRRNKLMKTKADPKCLVSEEEITKKYSPAFKKLKREMNSTIMKQLQFIHGGCSPVVIVPGLFASRLSIEIECEEFLKEGDQEKELRFFCGPTICPGHKSKESHIIWPSLTNAFFGMMYDHPNRYGACFGYFFEFYNTKNACDDEHLESNSKCKYSKYVKIVPYGSDKEAVNSNGEVDEDQVNKFNFGLNAINDFLSAGVAEGAINNHSAATKGYSKIVDQLTSIGLASGFSIVAVPYDFREGYCKNKNFQNTFHDALGHLFKLTGKKAVIIAHSYGNLNVLHQLTSSPEENMKDLKKWVSHYISIAPPFIGAKKADLLLAKGTDEFKSLLGIIDVPRFSQSLYTPFVAGGHALRPVNPLKEMLNDEDENVKKVGKILGDVMKSEVCTMLKHTCTKTSIHLKTLFNKEFNWMDDAEFCNTSTTNKKHFDKEFPDPSSNSPTDVVPLTDPCSLNIIDFDNCAEIIKDNNRDNDEAVTVGNFCNDFENQKRPLKGYYIDDCATGKEHCVNKFLSKHHLKPNYFSEIKTLDQKRRGASSKYTGIPDSITSRYVDVGEKFDQMSKMCTTGSKMLNPGIPTTIIFNRSYETFTGFKLLRKDIENISRKKILYESGDQTVNYYSSLFPGLKWLNQHKSNKEKFPRINLIDYCAPANPDSQYHYKNPDSLKEDSHYKFLHCDCLKKMKDGQFYDKSKLEACSHAVMLLDSNIVNLISDIVSDVNTLGTNNDKKPIGYDEETINNFSKLSEEFNQLKNKYGNYFSQRYGRDK